jgi:hypothetical protein
MTSELFQNSEYSGSSLEAEAKTKLVKKLARSVKKLKLEIYESFDPSIDSIDRKINTLLELADRLNDRQKFCRGCFTISDSVKTCCGCWEIDICSECMSAKRMLQRCSSCSQQVCWKKKCKICRNCVSKQWKD